MRKKNTGKAAHSRPSSRAPSRRSGDPLPLRGGALPIVGIGASAGGLEALEQFLAHVPEASGLAFVIVQHLDPTREGIMPELLQRATRMAVAQVKDRTKVEPNCVYVIPPNKDLSILRGVLHLLDPSSPRGLRLPIDSFFRALAEDQQAGSVGIILSGMGTDGTLGVKAIKERGGVVLAQTPASARFDSMPRSAIETGMADVVAPAEELAGRLITFLHHAPHAIPAAPSVEGPAKDAVEKIVLALRSRSRHDFSQYKKSTLYRRIERRMGLHQIESMGSYARFLQENPQEQDLLFNELLIGVTSFFRDPAAWEALREKVFPALFGERAKGGALRAWIPACSTGEEAYSLAMVFKEALEKSGSRASFSLQIFATDLDRSAIEKARQGVYPANIASDVSPERLRRFFLREEDGRYRVCKEIRDMVVLAPQDVIRDPPFTKLDLLVCRNLLIYLEPELQRRLMPLFHYSLNPGGVLFLGSSETVGGHHALFAPLDQKLRLYRRKDSADRPAPLDFPSSFFSRGLAAEPEVEPAKPIANLQSMADELILRQFGPAGALVSAKGDIFYVSGRTGKYLEPAAGKANWNIFAMAREGLRQGLASAIPKASRQKRVVTVRGLTVGTDGKPQGVDLTVRPLQEPEALRGMFLVVFGDAAAVPATSSPKHGRRLGQQAELDELQRTAKQLHEELRSTREDMQTSQEELRSANEELQSTNEELQSTNEELTTSKEELQSMNEELQTVNGEMQAKLDELSRANNDMKNLLNSTEIATLFLDRALHVRRFTSQTSRIMKVMARDVGRTVTDIASDLLYPGLADDVHEVLRTLVSHEKEVTTADGRWFTARIMPYRTLDEVIDGVVITFAETTTAKALEAELRSSRKRFSSLIENLPPSLTILDESGRIVPRSSVVARIAEAKSVDVSAWKVVVGADGADREAAP